MRFSVALATAALTAILSASSVSSLNPYNVLVSHSCSGVYEFAPGLPVGIGIDLSMLDTLLLAIARRIYARSRCQCPSITTNQYDLNFDPMTAVLNMIAARTSKGPANSCANADNFPVSLTQFGELMDVSFPATCSLATWQTKGVCSVAYNIPELDVKLSFGAWKCSRSINNIIPAFRLSCLGAGCETLVAPCSSSSDCNAPQTCMSLFPDVQSQQSFVQMARQMILLAAPPGQETCFNTASGNPADDFVASLMTLARSFFDKKVIGSIGFCGLPELISGRVKAFSPEALEFQMTPTKGQPQCLPFGDQKILVKLPYAVPWDGLLGVRRSVFGAGPSTTFSLGSTGPRTGKYNVLQWTCNGEFQLSEGVSQFRAKMGARFVPTLSSLAGMLKKFSDCIGPLSFQQFMTRYGLWSLNPILYIFDKASGQFSLGPDRFDYLDFFGPRGSLPEVLNLPSTCNFDTWVKKGRCGVRYTGFTELIDSPISLDVVFSRCPGAASQSSFKASCSGPGCAQFFGNIQFASDIGECGPKEKPMDLNALLEGAIGGFLGDVDVIGRFITPQRTPQISGLCDVFSMQSSGLNPKCGGAAPFARDLKNILFALGVVPFNGTKFDPTSTSNVVCIPDLDAFLQPEKITNWAMNQFSFSQKGITINNIAPLP